jgi:hypothetical protein
MNKALVTLAALTVAGSAMAAEDPLWTYADIGYQRSSSGSEDTEGFNLRGSIEFADKWHASLLYADGEVDGGKPSGVDYDGYELRLGIHPALSANTDYVFEFGYFDGEDDGGAGSVDEFDGYSLTTGIRTMWTERLELNAFVGVRSGDFGPKGGASWDFTEVIVQAGGQYLFTDNIGVGVDLLNGGSLSGNTANFYARFNF